ncbi:D-inositol-3-phosphate glycosyltransferase [Candidatus Gugararchaeum adminiculabundum]|nr:D-inositol-3-phosphate glycosyltransferase [Candidatus Gugararchaeum adminiculabundum]
MKICMLDPLFHPYYGGAEKVVLEIGKRLVKRGHEITVLTSTLPNAKEKLDEIDGIVIRRTPAIYFENLPSFMPPPYTIQPLINRDILKMDVDAFHIHNRFWYGYGTLAAVKLLKRKKLVLTLHNAKPEGISFGVDVGGQALDLLHGNRIKEAADRIICVSDYTRRVTVPSYCMRKASVIYNGVDVEKFTPAKEKEGQDIKKMLGAENGQLILTNARLVTQKGLNYLIDAFALLKKQKEFADSKLCIIGHGNLKGKLEAQASGLGLVVGKDVIFTTGIAEKDLPHYYNAADVFALPSLWEPSAVVLYEGLASGCAIVCANIGGNEEIVGDAGEYVKARDVNGLAEKIMKVLSDADARRKMQERARERAVKNFTWDIAADKYEKVYEELISGKKK